jgi:hypothetical protein
VPERIADPLPSDYRSIDPGMSTVAKVMLLVLILGLSTVGAFLLLRRSDDGSRSSGTTLSAGERAADAGAPFMAPGDAGAVGSVANTSSDAGATAPAGAPPAPVPPSLPRRSEIDAGPKAAPDPGQRPSFAPSPVTIVLHTDPPGGAFLLNGRAIGIEGSKLTRPRGTRLDLVCEAPYHKQTPIALVFDDKTRAVTCPLVRKVLCNKELKNPFDPCPK